MQSFRDPHIAAPPLRPSKIVQFNQLFSLAHLTGRTHLFLLFFDVFRSLRAHTAINSSSCTVLLSVQFQG